MNPRARAFTITELLVVITLMVILILIAVPSFQAMINSSEEALAQSQLASGLRAARDAAVRSNGAGDSAAVFFFEPGGRTTILACVKVGEFNDQVYSQNGAPAADHSDSVRREVFVPALGFAPVRLPKYWMVRAYAPGTAVNTDDYHEWYGQSMTANNGTTDPRWVFPETGFYNSDVVDSGKDRSTFMVRFQAGTGVLLGSSIEPALVLAPRANLTGRGAPPYSTYRADRDGMDDPVRFVRTVLSLPITSGNALTTLDNKRMLIGRKSSDTVLARPVMQLALYNEAKMAAAFGARLDPETGSLYQGATALGGMNSYKPTYVTGGTPAVTMANINTYILGNTSFLTATNSSERQEARLYSLDRYSGSLRELEVQP